MQFVGKDHPAGSSSSRGRLPRGARLPAVVQTYGFWRDPHAYLRWCRGRYGSTFTMRPLGKPPLVFMAQASDIKAIVTAPADVLRPGEGGAVIAPLVGRDSFMLADGDDHLAGRRRILPGFHYERVSAHTQMVRATVEREIASWPLDTPVAMNGRLRALTLHVILHAIFGVGDERVDELHRRLVAMFSVAASLTLHTPALRYSSPWRRVWRQFLADRDSVDALLAELIVERAHSRAHDRGLLALLLGPIHVDSGADAIGSVRRRADVADSRRPRNHRLGAGLGGATARAPSRHHAPPCARAASRRR